ncbi:SRPBCC family protein [Maribacter aestuarii]|uniref:SRPBCC family protein n=1 Tax=Maribacter aestuarii TaxID=1130723 RepID=UPI00248A94C5|nr:SRPBCC domain-containing protein [Maribacter aestuarii]
MDSFSIYHNLTILSAPQKVFEAITHPEHLNHWWTKKCSGIPREGEIYNFFFTAEYDWYSEVVKCKTNEQFYISMTESDADWDSTTFGFDLKAISDGTQLNFSHRGWPQCNEHFKRSSYCWAILLLGLKSYVEKGIIVPFEERQ